jgi:hypothetical protein
VTLSAGRSEQDGCKHRVSASPDILGHNGIGSCKHPSVPSRWWIRDSAFSIDYVECLDCGCQYDIPAICGLPPWCCNSGCIGLELGRIHGCCSTHLVASQENEPAGRINCFDCVGSNVFGLSFRFVSRHRRTINPDNYVHDTQIQLELLQDYDQQAGMYIERDSMGLVGGVNTTLTVMMVFIRYRGSTRYQLLAESIRTPRLMLSPSLDRP